MPRRLPEFLRPVEIEAMLAATKLRASPKRDALLLLCGLGAGLRCSEIVRLRVEDVDQDAPSIFVRLGKGAKDRYVPIPPWLASALRDWIADRKLGWVFPSPSRGKPNAALTSRAAQLIVAETAKLAGLVKHIHPHTLRHTYATMLLRSGADLVEIQRLLGHSNLATTSLYLHCATERLQAVVNKLQIGER